MRARRPDNAKDDRAFSSGVKCRDGWVCRLEVWTGRSYAECGSKGSPMNPIDAAHIYPRNQCGPIKFEIVVGLAACRDHHDLYDRHDDSVRVPLKREHTAFKAINLASKVPIARRMPPSRPLAGEKSA